MLCVVGVLFLLLPLCLTLALVIPFAGLKDCRECLDFLDCVDLCYGLLLGVAEPSRAQGRTLPSRYQASLALSQVLPSRL